MNKNTQALIKLELTNWMQDIKSYPQDTDISDDCETLAQVLFWLEDEYDFCLSASTYLNNLGQRAYNLVTALTATYYSELHSNGVVNMRTDNRAFEIINEFEQWIAEESGSGKVSQCKKAKELMQSITEDMPMKEAYKRTYRAYRLINSIHNYGFRDLLDYIYDYNTNPKATLLASKVEYPTTFDYNNCNRYQIHHHWSYYKAKM